MLRFLVKAVISTLALIGAAALVFVGHVMKNTKDGMNVDEEEE